MFENLSERLERSFKILKGEGKITEINVAETLKDVRRALLDADVNYKVAKSFTDSVKQKAMGMNVLTAVKPSQLMVKIVHDELAELMGGKAVELTLENRPAIVLMSGLQGSGKTTFSGKLANMLKNKQHKNPLLVACDVYRPAAIQQLHVVGESVGVPVYSEPDNKNVVEIANNAIREAKAKNYNVVIIDTAGRLAVDEEMMNEIATLKEAVNPDETLFVVDAMTGQDAVNTAKEFNDRLDFDGVVLTKLDGDTCGGAALSIRTVVTKPIKFVGTGEKMEAIDVFHPDRMADRILGMGDIVSLVERAQEQFDEKQAKELEKKQYPNFVPKDWTECYKLPLHLDLYGCYAFDADGGMALSCFNYKYDERGNYMAGEQERIKHIVDIINGEKPSDFESEWELDENETCQINYKGEFQFLVRGWGHLTGCGGLNLPAELAAEMQDGFINYILGRLNGR